MMTKKSDEADRSGRVRKAALSGSLGGLLLLLFVAVALAATSGTEQLANYKGKDREQILIEGAKKEGLLSVYSAMNAKDSKPLVDGFSKKYPFIKIDLFAGRGEDVVARLMTEQKGRKFTADTFDAPTINVEKLRREGLLIPYYTPAQDVYNKKHIDLHKYWVPIYHNILTFVYNTNEIKDPPKTWQDLLDPKWKGKMSLEDTDEVWVINFYKVWGEAKAKDYFTRLGKQDLKIVHGHSVMQQMLIAGECISSPTQYLHQAIADKKTGAPLDWVIMDPMVVGPEGMSLMKNSSHPHAALLFIDYATSKEGQALIYGRGRNAAYPGMDHILKDADLLIDDPALSLDNFEYWQKLYKDLLIVPNRRR
jgi:iron(III) transport system substrate-binding protein